MYVLFPQFSPEKKTQGEWGSEAGSNRYEGHIYIIIYRERKLHKQKYIKSTINHLILKCRVVGFGFEIGRFWMYLILVFFFPGTIVSDWICVLEEYWVQRVMVFGFTCFQNP